MIVRNVKIRENNSGSLGLICILNETVLISKSRPKSACVQPKYCANGMMAVWFCNQCAYTTVAASALS